VALASDSRRVGERGAVAVLASCFAWRGGDLTPVRVGGLKEQMHSPSIHTSKGNTRPQKSLTVSGEALLGLAYLTRARKAQIAIRTRARTRMMPSLLASGWAHHRAHILRWVELCMTSPPIATFVFRERELIQHREATCGGFRGLPEPKQKLTQADPCEGFLIVTCA